MMSLPVLVMPALYSEDWRFAYAMSVGAGGAGCRRKPDGEVVEVIEVVQVRGCPPTSLIPSVKLGRAMAFP